MWDVRDPLGLCLNQNYLKWGQKWLNYGNLPKGGCLTQASIMPYVRDQLGLHYYRKYLKSGQKWPCYGQFTNERLRDSSEYHPLGLHLNQKYLKSGNKRLSYGQFTKGKLGDSSEYRVRCKGPIRTLFEPKISLIRPETAELWPIYQREVAWLKQVSCDI